MLFFGLVSPGMSCPSSKPRAISVGVLTFVRRTRCTGLRLHNRVAIVGPDSAFCDALQPLMESALREAFPKWGFRIVTAEEASSDIGPAERGRAGLFAACLSLVFPPTDRHASSRSQNAWRQD